MDLVDAHAHLQGPEPARDPDGVLRRAVSRGVRRVLYNGTRPEDWPALLELARGHREVVPFFGLHPWYAARTRAEPDWLDRLESCLDTLPAGVGEIGLDAARPDAAVQRTVFAAQLGLARRRGLPVCIHCVRAWGPLLEELRERGPAPRSLLHAYGGPPELVPVLAGLGAYFSFSARQLERAGRKTLGALRAAPLERLLLETDSPSPGGRAEPADLAATLAFAARALGAEEDALARRLLDNARRFLGSLWRP